MAVFRYYLSYNEFTGKFMLVATGKTLVTTGEEKNYKTIGGSNEIQEIKNFVMAVNFIKINKVLQTGGSITETMDKPFSLYDILLFWKNKYHNLDLFLFNENDF